MKEEYDGVEAEMPSGEAQLQFRLRFPNNTRIGPLPAQSMLDLYSGGGVPNGAFVRREPDGAWLPFHTVFRNVQARKKRSDKGTVRDRRLHREFTIIERRRGDVWQRSLETAGIWTGADRPRRRSGAPVRTQKGSNHVPGIQQTTQWNDL
jgi:hypothetical protein